MSLDTDPYAEFPDAPAPGAAAPPPAASAALAATADPYAEFADAPAPGSTSAAPKPRPDYLPAIQAPAGVAQYDEDGAPLVGMTTNEQGRAIPQYGVAGQPGSRAAPAPVPTQDSGTLGSLWHGVQQAVPGIDRLAAASGAVGAKVGAELGLNKTTAGFGDIYDQLLRERQAQDAADAQAHPYAYYGGEVGGALGLGGAVTKAAEALPIVGRAFEAAPEGASLLARGRAAVRQGSALGALYGAGDAAPGEVEKGATLGALGGGVVGGAAFPIAAGVGAAVRAVTGAGADPALIEAFDRQTVVPMGAQVGGTGTRAITSIAKATLGSIPLAQAAQRSIQTAQAARDRIAAAIGRVTDDTGAGQAAQNGVEGFIGSTAAKATKLYNAIPIAAERPAVLTNTKQALADLNAGLSSNPELSKTVADSKLAQYQRAIEGHTETVPTGVVDANGNPITRTVQKGGQLSWQDLKAFRSHIGEKAGAPSLTSDISQQALRKLYGALSQDMQATAKAEGPQALAAFNRANGFYRARQARIDNVLKLITGNDLNKSPEDAFKQVQSWSKEGGDAAGLGQAMRSLTPDEANTIRASIFSRMGGEDFSPGTFTREWSKIDPRAKAVLFPDARYRQDLDDIAKIAAAMKRAPEFNNHSGTGHVVNGVQLAEEALEGHPIKAAAIAAAQYSVGKLLASPRFARWVASAPKQAAGAPALAHVNRLTAIAGAEPAIANEVLALQEHLARAFQPEKLAAQPDDNQGNRSAARQP